MLNNPHRRFWRETLLLALGLAWFGFGAERCISGDESSVRAAANTKAPAETVTSVLELFTSQGCSSCPPADRLLTTLARDPSRIALTFPIDYWDFIGWKDTFAEPAFTARQKAYAAARGDSHVYTPQAVVDGLVDTVGSDRAAIEQAVTTYKGHNGALAVPIQLRESDGVLHIDIGAGEGGPAGVYVLRVLRSRTVTIGRGENSGHTVTYTNVVRVIRKIGEWDGTNQKFSLSELRGDDEGYVVLLQQGSLERPGAILAAAKGVGL
jgi:hypothetical protein